MTDPFVSLKTDRGQLVRPGVWTIVRFPYNGESYDPLGMHEKVDPTGYEVRDWQRDDRSGLIWPAVDGPAFIAAMLHWEPASRVGGYKEIRDQFVRDPLGLATGRDTTATDHRVPTPGMQCITKVWPVIVHPNVPLAVRVLHNDRRPRLLTLAELKLLKPAIHLNEGA